MSQDTPLYEAKTIFEAKVYFGYAFCCNGGGFCPAHILYTETRLRMLKL